MLPALAAEGIPLGPPFAELGQRMHQRSVWLGPRGTQTPLHCDPYFNLFCQVQSFSPACGHQHLPACRCSLPCCWRCQCEEGVHSVAAVA